MTTNASALVVGVFEKDTQAKKAIDDLLDAGFSKDQIGFAWREGGLLKTHKLHDDFVSQGIPEAEAHYYQQEFDDNHVIVFVDADGHQQEVARILRNYGAGGTNISSTQAVGEGDTANTTAQQYQTDAGDVERIQLREEKLRATKQPVQTGEVGIRKEVVTEQQTINVPTTREEVVVERRPASGQPSDTPIGEGETYRVPVREEQVTVEKQPVVREEVSLGKRQVQETQRVTDTVKREKAHLERDGNVPIHDTKTDPYHPSQKDVEDLLENR